MVLESEIRRHEVSSRPLTYLTSATSEGTVRAQKRLRATAHDPPSPSVQDSLPASISEAHEVRLPDDLLQHVAELACVSARGGLARAGSVGRRAVATADRVLLPRIRRLAEAVAAEATACANSARDEVVKRLESLGDDAPSAESMALLRRVDWANVCLDDVVCRSPAVGLPIDVRNGLESMRTASTREDEDKVVRLMHRMCLAVSHALDDLRLACGRDSETPQRLCATLLVALVDAPHCLSVATADPWLWRRVVELAGPDAPTIVLPEVGCARPDLEALAALRVVAGVVASRLHLLHLDALPRVCSATSRSERSVT